MTLIDYISSVEDTTIQVEALGVAEVWSRSACCGYAIRAMQNAGITEDQITEAAKSLGSLFDSISIEQAEKIYIEY